MPTPTSHRRLAGLRLPRHGRRSATDRTYFGSAHDLPYSLPARWTRRSRACALASRCCRSSASRSCGIHHRQAGEHECSAGDQLWERETCCSTSESAIIIRCAARGTHEAAMNRCAGALPPALADAAVGCLWPPECSGSARGPVSTTAGAASSGGGTGAAGADNQKVLNVYNWSDYIDPTVVPAFEKEYASRSTTTSSIPTRS